MNFSNSIAANVTAGEWAVFIAVVSAILIFDLGYLHRQARAIKLKDSLLLVGLYGSIAFAFGIWVWLEFGTDAGALFFTALIIEQSLSIDNVFVMSVIFTYFAIPQEHRHRVLFWGILGAIVFRAIMIFAGTAAVASFDWLLLIFAAILVFTGIKLLFMQEEDEPDLERNRVVRFVIRHLPVTKTIHGKKFFAREPDPKSASGTALKATPLFLALVIIEGADIAFAVDSIPAVLALSQDVFIVYTSNIFAILGLRALFFVVDALIAKCRYLKPALSAILVLIGGKIVWDHMIGKVDPVLCLIVTVAILGGAFTLSAIRGRAACERGEIPAPKTQPVRDE
ncbi:tellurite resistance protein TerC [Rhodobium orientis]|uniref:Tellurium resistance protein TerC n=1 Tax=Rhodobium orientis TaxID=34017 RepID=A0A327JR61_9HYPH|nr:TerC/Alx family metal homeostasis membrane protein [Rhodobium orientis]MBB4302200.1 tellurite resistance protein TerC [Rhodobium orientis]MBK5948911.1 hypothetical protein [Rhodobium orientis]RAI27904.1 hypothetical protein CH339_08340 [Rhodobium orientis]